MGVEIESVALNGFPNKSNFAVYCSVKIMIMILLNLD
jgi:hypothetical protein